MEVSGPKTVFFSLFTLFCLLFVFPLSIHGQADPVYGPRFEIGGGLGFQGANEQPHWTPDSFQLGIITLSMRLFKGISIQGGLDYGRGGRPLSDSLSWGDHFLKINEGTYNNSGWAGIRYELPLRILRRNYLEAYSMYCAGGMTWANYGVQSTEWINKGVTETDENERNFHVADLNGMYVTLAARWHFNIAGDENPEESTSWPGTYGVDFGVRYNRYGESSVHYPNIPKLPSNYASYQVFLIGFIKFDLFN